MQHALASLGGLLWVGACFALLGCASEPLSDSSFGPPRFDSLHDQSVPRLARFREKADGPLRMGLWMGMDNTSQPAAGLILPLPENARTLPSREDWELYKQWADDHAQGKTHAGIVRLELARLVPDSLLDIPVPTGRIIGAALNHADHMKDLGFSDEDIQRFKSDPPRFFWKNSQAVGPFAAIRLPEKKVTSEFRSDAAFVDHEVEIALIVGRKILPGEIREDAPLEDLLAGIMLADDVSDREPQIWAMANPAAPDALSAHWPLTGAKRPWNKSAFDLFTEGKSFPTSAVLGPFLLPPHAYAIVYGQGLELWSRRQSRSRDFSRRQDGLVCRYVASPQRLLAAALEDPYLNIKELAPGDVLLMGTPAGTILKGGLLAGLLPKDMLYLLFIKTAGQKFLRPGDEIWAESSLLGFQSNIIKNHED